MKSPENEFAQAVELILSADPKLTDEEKRRAARAVIRLPVEIKLSVATSAIWTTAQLHDLSPRGAKLETTAKLEEGASFLLRLPPSKDAGKKSVPLLCRVAHCAAQKSSFLIGAEFVGNYTPQNASRASAAADLNRIKHSILD